MVTFSELENYGRLGNQLFQIATVFSHAKKNSFDYGFKNWKYNEYLKTPLPYFIGECLSTHREKDPFTYNEIPNINSINLLGYYQNEKYFNQYKDSLNKLFEPSDKVKEILKDELSYYVGQRITAIHVRRGDYLKLPLHHPIPSVDYYLSSMESLKKITDVFMVFSDDIEWCKNNFSDDVIFSETKDEFIDLYKMSMCDNFIISNSSFSWWGSYLNNNNPVVIAPDPWVGTGYKNTGWEGVYRNKMIKKCY